VVPLLPEVPLEVAQKPSSQVPAQQSALDTQVVVPHAQVSLVQTPEAQSLVLVHGAPTEARWHFPPEQLPLQQSVLAEQLAVATRHAVQDPCVQMSEQHWLASVQADPLPWHDPQLPS
jgi:hypothetical protein